MPTYQYACKDCGYRFDQVQAFTDPSLTECPRCAGHLRKVFGSVGVVFKGSGFYRTDSRSASSVPAGHTNGSADGSSAAAKSDSPAGAKNGAGASGTSNGSAASSGSSKPAAASGSAATPAKAAG